MSEFANLSCVVPHWEAGPTVTALTTTRLGGVSQKPFDSLNLGLHVGDQQAAVLENRRRLVHSFDLPSEPVWLNQTHGTCVTDVDKTSDIEADGAFTRTPDKVLAVLTADCLPVVITDSQSPQLAVVHAGWRGLASGIVQNAIACFTPGSQLHAWLGPAIGPTMFEVGEDVKDAFVSQHADNSVHFAAGNLPGKYWADLYGLATSALRLSGCHAVSGADYCTHTQSALFHSHRRDGTASGRMATVAWLARNV